MFSTERPSAFRFLIAITAWTGALAVYANALYDLLAKAFTRPAVPVYWLVVFALALALTWILLPQRDRSTLRWLGQAWIAALISYVGGFAALPRGPLLIDVFLLCLSAEGIRIGSTALARRLSAGSRVQTT